MVGIVQPVQAPRQQFHRLADAAWLVNAALLADRQVHRQVQKRVGALGLQVVIAGDGRLGVGQFGVELGVLGNPQAGQGFNGLHGLLRLGFGMDGAEKAPHIGLGGLEHRARSVARAAGWPGLQPPGR